MQSYNLKRKLILLCSFTLCLAATYAQEKYAITVQTVKALPDYKVMLSYTDGTAKQTNNATYSNGKFKLNGTVPNVQRAELYIVPKTKPFEDVSKKEAIILYLESGNLVVQMNEALDEATLSGTPANNDLQAFNEQSRIFNQQVDGLEKEHAAASEKKEYGTMQNIEGRFRVLKIENEKAEQAFFDAHPNSWVSFDWLTRKLNVIREKSKAVAMFNTMGNNIKESPAGKKYANLLSESQAVEIGSQAPDFICKDRNDKDVAFSSLRGKYVLLDFWASWCGPCRKENPNVVNAYNAYKDKNFTVLGVSLDSTKAPWIAAIEKDGLPWEQLSDLMGWKCAPAKLYGVRSVPSNFLIDPQGVIVAIGLRGEELSKKLAEILK